MTEEKSASHAFGVPVAIVLAGALIAAALYWRGPVPTGSAVPTVMTLDDHLLAYAAAVGVDRATVEQCLQQGAHKAGITADQQAGVAAGVTGTPSFIINGERVDGAVPQAEFEQTIDAALAGKKGSVKVTTEANDPTLGAADAPVTMVEFSDFECPFCQQFHATTFGSLKAKYIDTGQVRLVYKDFPLTNIHPHAQRAAEAASCVATQGKFWEYADRLFGQQAEWTK